MLPRPACGARAGVKGAAPLVTSSLQQVVCLSHRHHASRGARPGDPRFWRQPDRRLRAGARPGLPAAAQAALHRQGIEARVVNAGVSGDTTAGGLARLDWALADKPDLVILALGANDALRGIDPRPCAATSTR